jgi:hypothetical protein
MCNYCLGSRYHNITGINYHSTVNVWQLRVITIVTGQYRNNVIEMADNYIVSHQRSRTHWNTVISI